MRQFLRSTTSLGLTLALALPHGATAQEGNPICEVDLELIAQNSFPCAFEGEVVHTEEALTALVIETEEGAAAAEAAVAEQLTADEQEAEGNENNAGNANANAAANANANSAVDTEAQAEAEAAEAEAQQQAEADAAAAQEAAEAEAAQAEAEAAAAQEAAEAEAQQQADQAEAELQSELEAAEAEAAASETEQSATTETETETTAEVETGTETEADATTEAQTESGVENDLTPEQQAAREARRAERRAARQAERQAAAAASADEGAEAEEVVTQEVTEDNVRSSDEEFQTGASGQAAEAQADEDDGLSNLEKALIVGLGAVAVGSLLKSGERVVSNSGDRLVLQDQNGDLRVLKDEDSLLRRPGDEVRTQTFNDGSSRTIVAKPDGSQIVTVRAADGAVLRRVNIDPQGREYVLFDDTQEEQEVVLNALPQVSQQNNQLSSADEAALRRALQAEFSAASDRSFSLRQVREIRQVRDLVPQLELDAIQFRTGSAAIPPEQARSLVEIGRTLKDLIAEDPRTVILVEGHTDAVGDATYNLALSDRRAETVALALTEYFEVPPENMVTQGYGESALKVQTPTAEQANRRAVVRNVTNLLR